MVTSRLSLLITLGCLCACGAEGGSARARRNLAVDSTPILQIRGTAESGELMFGSAIGGTVLTDGRIVIGDALEHSVRFFAESGNLRHSIGRRGEGPGEFGYISWIGRCADDSLFVWDSDLKRMTLIDASGSFVTSFRVPDDAAVAAASILSCSNNGHIAVLGTPANLISLTEHYSAPLWIVNTRGVIEREFGPVPALEARPLGRVTSLALVDDRLYVGTKESLTIDVYDHTGSLLSRMHVADSFRVPTAIHYEAAIDNQVSRLGSVDDRRIMKEMMLRKAMPEQMPPYAGLFGDPAGTVWVELSLKGDPQTWLRRLDRAGNVTAELHIPWYVKVLEVGEDYILGTYDDESGEPYVAVFRIG